MPRGKTVNRILYFNEDRKDYLKMLGREGQKVGKVILGCDIGFE